MSLEKKNDYVNFYLDQRNEKKATMDGHDKVVESMALIAKLQRSYCQLMPEARRSVDSEMVILEASEI